MAYGTAGFGFEAASNLLTPQGVSRVASLGVNRDVDGAEDIWAGASLGVLNSIDHKVIQWPAAGGVSMEVVSGSSSDAAAGTGARRVVVAWLTATGVPQTTTITLTGMTPVSLGANVWRVNNLVIPDTAGVVGSAGTNVGAISVRATGGLGATYAYMAAGAGISQSSQFTVPLGSSMDLMGVLFGVSEADSSARRAEMSLAVRGGVSGRVLAGLTLPVTGSSTPYRHESPGVPINVVPALSDIWVRVDSISQTNATCIGSVFGWIRPTNYFR